jgi:hypothetical protein
MARSLEELGEYVEMIIYLIYLEVTFGEGEGDPNYLEDGG